MTAIEIPTPDPRTFDDASRPFAEAVSGQFAVKRMIGRGGMGVVFLARDRRLDRLVAIKTLPPTLARDPGVRERFLRETRTAGSMAHPNIVPIHGADEINGHVFFVMSYIDGASLAALTRAHGKLEPRKVAQYLRDVAAALTHAHGRGIIHRDIKAENILIERATDRALVTDFGIARLAEATPLTVTGQVLGTVHYVSPEQVSGDPVDVRSDIYSLGVVGFFALTGAFPFDAEIASAVMIQHVTRTAPPVASVNRDVPSALAAVIDRCLQKDRAHRYASAAELHAAIEAAIPALDAPPVLVSDTEAHAVWRRAAELQSQTGVQPRPEPVARPRAATAADKVARRGIGFGVSEVVSAAAEAGIDERYVEHALVEHGLSPAHTPVPAVKTKQSGEFARAPEQRSVWSGSPFPLLPLVTLVAEVPGELPARQIERLINVLREQTDSMGITAASTRELSWRTSDMSRALDVSAVPNDGRTTITLSWRMHFRTLVTIVATSVAVGIVSAGVIGVPLVEGLGRRNEEIGFLIAIIAGTATALKLGHTLTQWFRKRGAQRLRALCDVIATKTEQAQERGGSPE